MAKAREFQQAGQRDVHRAEQPHRDPDHTEAVGRPRAGSDSGTGMTMGIPYDAPERGRVVAAEPVTRVGLVWRIVASLVLVAAGVNAVVRSVPLWQTANVDQASGAWVGALALIVLAGLFFAYPVVNLVRWVRAKR